MDSSSLNRKMSEMNERIIELDYIHTFHYLRRRNWAEDEMKLFQNYM